MLSARTGSNVINPWLIRRKPNPGASVRLFCFPYAGGGASIFRTWPDVLPTTIEVCAVQLPGREARIAEAPLTRLPDMLRGIAQSLPQYFDKPFAFFGHSMGAMLSLELARLLRKEHGLEPSHLFISGCRALQLPDPDPPTYNLPDPQFVEELRRLNGTEREILEHPELLQFVIPLLRADFAICQTYRHVPAPPLDCPITVFGGMEDETKREHLEQWRDQTTSTFTLRMFPGDHFFLHAAQPQILQIISRLLTSEKTETVSTAAP